MGKAWRVWSEAEDNKVRDFSKAFLELIKSYQDKGYVVFEDNEILNGEIIFEEDQFRICYGACSFVWWTHDEDNGTLKELKDDIIRAEYKVMKLVSKKDCLYKMLDAKYLIKETSDILKKNIVKEVV